VAIREQELVRCPAAEGARLGGGRSATLEAQVVTIHAPGHGVFNNIGAGGHDYGMVHPFYACPSYPRAPPRAVLEDEKVTGQEPPERNAACDHRHQARLSETQGGDQYGKVHDG